MPELTYRREGTLIRVKLTDMTNHEIRDVMVGIWLRLDDDDRTEHIKELLHYLDPENTPSTIAQLVGYGEVRRHPPGPKAGYSPE